MSALEGKAGFMTGGGCGIGLAAAKRFAAEGAFVFLTGRGRPELNKAVKKIARNAIEVMSDVFDLSDLDRVYKEVADKQGHIDVLFANAEVVETPALTPEHFVSFLPNGPPTRSGRSVNSLARCGIEAECKTPEGWTVDHRRY